MIIEINIPLVIICFIGFVIFSYLLRQKLKERIE